MNKRKVILSVTNDIATDQRVKRSAITLQQMGFDVCVAGRKLQNSLSLNGIGFQTKRFDLMFNKGALFYAEYNIRLFFYLLFSKPDLLFANDLDTLLPNYLISKIINVPLVYDSHEYFTGVPELENRGFVKGVWKKIEQFIFPKLKHVITVNQSIAALYQKEYGVKLSVVRNVPRSNEISSDKKELRIKYKLPNDKKIIILQGSGINVHRGAEEAVLAMQHVEGVLFLIIGGGDVFNVLKEIIEKNNLHQKVELRNKVSNNELMEITFCCDAGLSLDKDTNINYRFSLPNKLFDYLHAGIPVIASDLIEVKKIILHYQVGKIISSHSPKDIADAINLLFENNAEYQNLKTNTAKAKKELCWEYEKEVFISLISKIKFNK